MAEEQPRDRDRRWQDKTYGWLLLLSMVFGFAYSILILDEDLSSGWRSFYLFVLIAVWLLFVIEYAVRFSLSHHKWRFVGKHIPDLVATLFPLFRPLAELTVLNRVPYFHKRSGNAERVRLILFAVVFIVLFVYTIALSVYAVERHAPGATITSFGDAIWWACVTMTTVGYGDYTPVTVHGRVLAVILMFGGVVIVGIATATIISFLSERIAPRVGKPLDEVGSTEGIAELTEDQDA